jgi:hypothetical protein
MSFKARETGDRLADVARFTGFDFSLNISPRSRTGLYAIARFTG